MPGRLVDHDESNESSHKSELMDVKEDGEPFKGGAKEC